MVRMICQFMNHGEYQGEACIYSHSEVLDLIRDMAGKLLPEKETRSGIVGAVREPTGQSLVACHEVTGLVRTVRGLDKTAFERI